MMEVICFGQNPIPNCTHGRIERIESLESKYITARNIDIWLPPNYNIKKKYAVLYMQDGQMLYDKSITWNKQSWEIDSIAASLINSKMDGVIATNTTLSRDAVAGLQHAEEMGGLSGSVMTDMSLEVTRKLNKALDRAIPIIGVGGIDSPEAAQARLDAGASLVQVYSAFIYQGPSLVKRIVNAL